MDGLNQIAADPGRTGLFLDVDGVLAPIVEHRDDARVPDETRRQLVRLATRYALVAVVTGRPSDVARRIVGVDSLVYAGEHGLELDPAAGAWVERMRAFADASGWDDLERKPLSLAFHFRGAGDHAAAHAALEEIRLAASALGLRARFGRKVLEVLPPIDASKGTAVRALLSKRALHRALYAGDDTTDLDGFHALDGLELAVRVAVVSPEGPAVLAEQADIVVDSPESFAALLREL